MTQPAPSLLDRIETRIGQTIREKYRLEKVLGVGGMAAVYLATHRNGSRAALKILHPELAIHDVHRERFIREAYVANSIDHPGAVRVIDDDIADDNCPFLVMELLEGETLEGRRRRLGRLEPREVLRFAHALCDTLAAAHDHGVVHRDIKPENIFLTNLGSLKVLDFGIARVFHESGALGTRTGAMMGTPAFMPPEQALGRRAEIDPRTDIWAVGATVFTLLSGQFVHQAESPEEMMVRAATEPAVPLAEVLPEIPLPIAAIVDHALAFRRDERFVSAHVMRDAISLAYEEVFGEALEAMPMPCGPASVPRNSTRPVHSSDVATKVVGDLMISASAPTVVDGGGFEKHKPKAEAEVPTVVDVAGVQPTLAEMLQAGRSLAPPENATSVLDSPAVLDPPVRTHRSGELVPLSTRGRRRRLIVSTLALCAALVSIVAGVRHVTGGPVEKSTQILSCTQASDCQSNERCDDRGLCIANLGCVSNAECVAESGGKPAICRHDSGKCVALETPRCRVLAEKTDVENDDTIWLGAMYPEHDKSTPYGREAMLTVDLARRDFANMTGGLPPLKPGGRSRPIAVVACDDTDDYESVARHLIDDVGVSAIQGFGRSKEVLDLASRYFIPKGILALASNTATMISSIPHESWQPRLVFRVTSHAEMSSQPLAAVIRDIIEVDLRRKAGLLEPDQPLKIAIARSENVSGTSHTDAFVDALAKRRAAGMANNDEIRPFIFRDSSKNNPAIEDTKKIEDLIAFAPHIIVDGGAKSKIYALIEKTWPARLRHRLRYVVSYSAGSEPMRALVLMHPTVPTRLFLTNILSSAATRKFAVQCNGFYHENRTDEEVNAAPYDAFYIFAYAAMALGKSPLTGTNLALAIKRLLPPGEPVDVGPSGILPVFKILASGGNIDLNGAQTTIDFDLETGNASCDFQFNCFDRKTQRSVSGGVHFRARTGELEGTWNCP